MYIFNQNIMDMNILIVAILILSSTAAAQQGRPTVCVSDPAILVEAGSTISARLFDDSWNSRCEAVLRFTDPAYLPMTWTFDPINCKGQLFGQFVVPRNAPTGDAVVSWQCVGQVSPTCSHVQIRNGLGSMDSEELLRLGKVGCVISSLQTSTSTETQSGPSTTFTRTVTSIMTSSTTSFAPVATRAVPAADPEGSTATNNLEDPRTLTTTNTGGTSPDTSVVMTTSTTTSNDPGTLTTTTAEGSLGTTTTNNNLNPGTMATTAAGTGGTAGSSTQLTDTSVATATTTVADPADAAGSNSPDKTTVTTTNVNNDPGTLPTTSSGAAGTMPPVAPTSAVVPDPGRTPNTADGTTRLDGTTRSPETQTTPAATTTWVGDHGAPVAVTMTVTQLGSCSPSPFTA
ncbi:hypothetical protein CGMCC3_g9856 [Colletotrichum fructicola]|nr:uncharacterized protein CGMCC3_g9856 [Colletotrichum fructicola]KAE9574198.1 hypothetical protein CGMCC3_g9856 [Colletotrichum fructicola]